MSIVTWEGPPHKAVLLLDRTADPRFDFFGQGSIHDDGAQSAVGGGSSEKAHKYTPCEEEVMALPVHGEALNAFVTLPNHTSTRDDDVQLRISLKPSS
jgi:hypothetical protein